MIDRTNKQRILLNKQRLEREDVNNNKSMRPDGPGLFSVLNNVKALPDVLNKHRRIG